MTLLATALYNFFGSRFEKEGLLIATCQAFTVICARQPLLEALTVIFEAASFAAKAPSNWGFRVGAG